MIILILAFLTIRFNIAIVNLDIDTSKDKIMNNFEFIFKIYILNIIPIIKIKLDERKIKEIQESKIIERLSNINLKKITTSIEKRFNSEYKSIDILRFIVYVIKRIRPEILLFKLYLELGFEDIFLTTCSIPTISFLITLILKYGSVDRKLEKSNSKYSYKVVPVYNKYKINMKFDCIISIKFVHIISIVYNFFIKQRRRNKYGRTSYRGAYGYSHE